MSILQLSSGKFLVIDTVALDSELKSELDDLTENGSLIDSVLMTHPFHSLYLLPFYKEYPSARYYGTPRHIKIFRNLAWSGSLDDAEVLKQWEPDVYMRIPDGAEFVNPAEHNHLSCVFVFHPSSRTIHVDDTIVYIERSSCLLSFVGAKVGDMILTWNLAQCLYKTPEAPYQFKSFLQRILKDWDFDNICTAHIGNKIGGAKKALEETVANAEDKFHEISDINKYNLPRDPSGLFVAENARASNYGVDESLQPELNSTYGSCG